MKKILIDVFLELIIGYFLCVLFTLGFILLYNLKSLFSFIFLIIILYIIAIKYLRFVNLKWKKIKNIYGVDVSTVSFIIIFFYGFFFEKIRFAELNISALNYDYVGVKSIVNDETTYVEKTDYHGNSDFEEVYVNPRKNEGLFSKKNNFDFYIQKIKSQNELLEMEYFMFFETGISLGYEPVNFKVKNDLNYIEKLEKIIVYQVMCTLEILVLSIRIFIIYSFILVIFIFYYRKKAKLTKL